MNGVWWLDEKVVLATHQFLINQFGGDAGILNQGQLASTLARPKNLLTYGGENIDLFDLAACYLYGLLKNHCFIDGNKRTAIACTALFIEKNDYEFNPNEDEALVITLQTAQATYQAELVQADLAKWLRSVCKPT